MFGAIITYTLWLIYDLYALSYSGAITDGIIIVSNIYILLFRKEKKDFVVKGRILLKK